MENFKKEVCNDMYVCVVFTIDMKTDSLLVKRNILEITRKDANGG